jgi:hypothetical protein
MIFALALSVASSSFAKGRGNSSESSEDWFEVDYVEVEQIVNSDGTSTWTYRVTETGKGRDLSHWVLGLGDCHTVVSADPQQYEVGQDPRTGVYGIKWDVSEAFESGYFSFTVDGVYETGPVNFATKAGRSIHQGWVDGPTCEEGNDDDGGGVPEV